MSTHDQNREAIAALVKKTEQKFGGPSLAVFANDPPIRKHYAVAEEILREFDVTPRTVSEPQGEPSDAQVNRDYLAQVIHKAVYSRIPLDRLTDEAQADTYKRADAVVAALRAAGVGSEGR